MPIIDRLIGLVGFERDPQSDGVEREYNRSLADMSGGLRRVASFAAAAATSVVALNTLVGGMAITVAGTTDKLGKFAKARGLAFGDVQELIYAGQIFGSTEDQITSSLDNIQQKLAEFKRGQGDFQVLAQIGVSAQGADAFGFIERLAARFQTFSAERAQELGQKLGLDDNFIELLRSGTANIENLRNEARELGIILGDDAADNAANFNDALLRIQRVLGAVRDRVLLALVPAFTQLADRVAAFVKQNNEFIEQKLTVFIQTLFDLLVGLGNILVFVIGLWGSYAEAVGGTRNAIVGLGIAFAAFQLSTSVAMLKLIAGMRAVGLAATVVNAKVLLVPVLIAGAVAAALLVIEDFYRYLQGGESVIGTLVDGFKRWRSELEELKPVVDALLAPLDGLVKAGEALGTFAGKVATGEVKNAITDQLTAERVSPSGQFVGGLTAGLPRTTRNNARVELDVNVRGNIEGVPNAPAIVRDAVREGAARGLTIINPVTQ